ncbi:hypothetical protein AB434_0847 [Heyndrickxia coagulans]|uniref:Uncharacterized protein n=1 Tax=Heyndrickxia coagulans TaxID=1398 RepID=A0AAN0T2I5_HEYCO|nr:hypothetical protein SB48_HM08orf00487 [Heyndrickxia coagulans]AKN53252.1 hypothetical protein AB434_0847 [Heyndrickxia coagulans]KYC60888.1 hypothetical protein B4100_1687 [Heyndrickxia coagulans]KYC82774.1 hypothetical protein B4096_1621 [Heyndrickxia coagulans]
MRASISAACPFISMLDHHPDMQLKRLALRTAFEPRPVQ